MNYLIDGISGTGKSTVCLELQKLGYIAIDSDETFGYFGDPKTGLPTTIQHQLNWLWDTNKLLKELTKNTGTVFICGGAMNQSDFYTYFRKIFTLFVDDQTLQQRLFNRPEHGFGKKPEDLARQLEWNQGVKEYAQQRGTILIDATQPVSKVVADILNHVNS